MRVKPKGQDNRILKNWTVQLWLRAELLCTLQTKDKSFLDGFCVRETPHQIAHYSKFYHIETC